MSGPGSPIGAEEAAPVAPPAWPPLAPGDDPVAALEQRLAQPLADRATALAALTHKSYVNEHRGEPLLDNERLEFLGDAVIDLAVSHRLMERFPGAREGDLSKMRAAVVDEQGLAAMARTIDLGGLLRLGRGEELTGGRKKASLLADAMEAVVAVVYLEAGLGGVLRLVERFLGEAFARAAAGTLDRDYKTQLQELAQSRFKATPRYRVVAESGPDHAKVFVVELDLRGEPICRGSGRSKKDAEQAAARPALDLLARRAAGPSSAPDAAAGASGGPEPAATSDAAALPPGAGSADGVPAEAEAEAPSDKGDAAPEAGPPSPTQAASQPPSMEGSIEPVVPARPVGKPAARPRPRRARVVPTKKRAAAAADKRPAGKGKASGKGKRRAAAGRRPGSGVGRRSPR